MAEMKSLGRSEDIKSTQKAMEQAESFFIGIPDKRTPWYLLSLDYVDDATLNLLGNLCTENMTVAEGVSKTMAELGFDPYFRAYQKYYPARSGSHTVSELIK